MWSSPHVAYNFLLFIKFYSSVKPREEALCSSLTLLLICTWASPISAREEVWEGTTGSGRFRCGVKIEAVLPQTHLELISALDSSGSKVQVQLSYVAGSCLVTVIVNVGLVVICVVYFPKAKADQSNSDQTAPFLLQECYSGIQQLKISKHVCNALKKWLSFPSGEIEAIWGQKESMWEMGE